MVAAYVAAPTACVAATMQSVNDTERALAIGSAISAGLLVVGGLGCALAASRPTWRRGVVASAAMVTALGLIAACRAAGPFDRGLQSLFLVLVMFGAVYALTNARPRRSTMVRYFACFVGILVGTSVVSCGLGVSLAPPFAALFTALAGNPPVNSSDTDLIESVLGIVPGLLLGVLAWKTHNYGLDNAPAPARQVPVPEPEPADT